MEPQLDQDLEVLGTIQIPIGQVERNPSQPRKNFNEVSLRELADNIKQNGLLQDIVVRKLTENRYIIVAGERRWRAHKLNETSHISARVIICDDSKAYELSLLENLMREDIDLLEEALGYEYLRDRFQYTLERLGEVVSKNPSSVSNIMGILKEDPQVQAYVSDGTFTFSMLQSVRKLPNLHEKLELLRKVKVEIIRKSDVKAYVHHVEELYRIASQLNIDPEEVRRRGIAHKGIGGRFDIKEELAIPDDFQFFFICDNLLSGSDLEYFPRTTILSSAFTYMHSKAAAKRLASIMLKRPMIQSFFMDSGAVSAVKKKQLQFFENGAQLIQFYENHKPDICVALDVPAYADTFPPKEVVDYTLRNAISFRDWTPSFNTVKVYVLQGIEPEDYLRCFQGYVSMGVFEKDERQALAFGSIAKTSIENIIRKISLVLQDPDYQRIRPQLQFVHGFGVGQPKRIVKLYKLGINSFDALTTVILTAVGQWWIRGKSVHHLIQESSLSRRVRLLFNVASFWGMLCEEFAKQEGVQLADVTSPTTEVDLSFLDKINDEEALAKLPSEVEEDFSWEPHLEVKTKRAKPSFKGKIDWESFYE